MHIHNCFAVVEETWQWKNEDDLLGWIVNLNVHFIRSVRKQNEQIDCLCLHSYALQSVDYFFSTHTMNKILVV